MCSTSDVEPTKSTTTRLLDPTFVPYRKAAAFLSKLLEAQGLEFPSVGIICGSGLSGLSRALTGHVLTVPYGAIPGFPSHCTVEGHAGEIAFGQLSGASTICFRGRFHSYEGHDMKTVALPVLVMRCLGVQVVIVTNAAGGLNPEFDVGNVCAISDHLALPQLAGKNPLVGPNDDELGPRFPATSNAYNESLRAAAAVAAEECGFGAFFRPHATYAFVSGPMYESKAECRLLRSMGGDAVGMSTIPEVVAAHHCNMQVLCLSLITNKVVMAGDEGEAVANHEEVLQAVSERSEQMQTLVARIVTVLQRKVLPNLPPLRKVNLQVPNDECVLKPPPPAISALPDNNGSFLRSMLVGLSVFALGLVVGSHTAQGAAM